MIPSALEFVILGLAVYYGFYLVSEATITEWPRDRILTFLESEKAETFVTCPWCVSLWLSAAVYGAFLLSEAWTVGIATPFALAAFCGLVHRETKET